MANAPSLPPRSPLFQLKKWKTTPVKDNGLPILVPMHVKKGDTVQVISGDDKGKVGEVLQVRMKGGRAVPQLVGKTKVTLSLGVNPVWRWSMPVGGSSTAPSPPVRSLGWHSAWGTWGWEGGHCVASPEQCGWTWLQDGGPRSNPAGRGHAGAPRRLRCRTEPRPCPSPPLLPPTPPFFPQIYNTTGKVVVKDVNIQVRQGVRAGRFPLTALLVGGRPPFPPHVEAEHGGHLNVKTFPSTSVVGRRREGSALP